MCHNSNEKSASIAVKIMLTFTENARKLWHGVIILNNVGVQGGEN